MKKVEVFWLLYIRSYLDLKTASGTTAWKDVLEAFETCYIEYYNKEEMVLGYFGQCTTY